MRKCGVISVIDLFKEFDLIEKKHKSVFFFKKRLIFRHMCTTCSELPSIICTMDPSTITFRLSTNKSKIQIRIFYWTWLYLDTLITHLNYFQVSQNINFSGIISHRQVMVLFDYLQQDWRKHQ